MPRTSGNAAGVSTVDCRPRFFSRSHRPSADNPRSPYLRLRGWLATRRQAGRVCFCMGSNALDASDPVATWIFHDKCRWAFLKQRPRHLGPCCNSLGGVKERFVSKKSNALDTSDPVATLLPRRE